MAYYITGFLLGFLLGSLKWRTWFRKLKISYIRAVNSKASELVYGEMKDVFKDK